MSESTLEQRVGFLEQNGIPGVRDFFATSALSFLARESSSEYNTSVIAKRAYQIADAMINERMKGHNANPVA